MKDYFAPIINKGVAGVTWCDGLIKVKETAALSLHTFASPDSFVKCDKGANSINWAHVNTPANKECEALQPKETKVSPTYHPVTHKNEVDLLYSYHERAAIMEFDGRLTYHEAERGAFQEALTLFLTQSYPEILLQLEAIIYQPSLN